MKRTELEKKAALHILLLLYHAKRLDWQDINKLFLNWSMYQINILWHFYYENGKSSNFDNFMSIYQFIPEPTGPYCDLINGALEWLLNDDYIESMENPELTAEGLNLVKNVLSKDSSLAAINEWIDIMVTLQSMYGYKKLFRFIYRDNEFKQKFDSKDIILETQTPSNATVQFLNDFREAYDNALKEQNNYEIKITKKEYLIGYFGYIFDKIIKGEL